MIHASARGSLRIRDQLHEGMAYFIKNFGVGLNDDQFRPTRHEYRLTFNLRTVVTQVLESNIPRYGFSFVEFGCSLASAGTRHGRITKPISAKTLLKRSTSLPK